MSNGSLYTHIQNNIATVEFFHPASNSFPSDLLQRLATTFNELSENNNVHVIILKSEGNPARATPAAVRWRPSGSSSSILPPTSARGERLVHRRQPASP